MGKPFEMISHVILLLVLVVVFKTDGASIRENRLKKNSLFASSENEDHTPECNRKFEMLWDEVYDDPPIDESYQGLMKHKVGRMIDSWGKIPAGLQNPGSLNVPGDKDECLAISTPIYGKYCTLSLTSRTLKKDMELGVCLPDICTKNDVAIEAMEYTRMMFYDESEVEFSINQTQIEGMKCESSAMGQCFKDVTSLLPLEPTEWLNPLQWLHNKILDSWGKIAAGLNKGHTAWQGSKSECLAVGDFTEYCEIPTNVRVGEDPEVKKNGLFGICIPKTCHDYPMEFVKVVRKHLIMIKFHVDFDVDESAIKCGR